MNRRIQGVALILILLTGTPIRAARAGAMPTAQVEIASISLPRLAALGYDNGLDLDRLRAAARFARSLTEGA